MDESVGNRPVGLADSAPVALLAIDRGDGRIVAANDAATELFERSREELCGRAALALFPAAEADRYRDFFDVEVPDTAESSVTLDRFGDDSRLRIERPDGELVPVEVTCRVDAADGDGTVYCSMREPSGTVSHDRELQTFRKAIESSGHAIMLTEPDGTIEYVNDAFTALTGYEREQAVGATPRILNSGEHDPEFFRRMWETILAGETWESEIVNRRKDGSLIHVDHTISPVTVGDDVEKFVAVLRDVTDRKLDQQQLQVYHRVLRHNVRNKLDVIQAHAERIHEDAADPTLERQAASIERAGAELLEATLQVRTIQEKIADMDDDRVDVCGEVSRIAAAFEQRNDDATVDVVVPDGDAPAVSGAFAVAVNELVENAIEYADQSEPAVTIRLSLSDPPNQELRTGGEWVSIAVEDTGPGIPEHERETLAAGEETPLLHGNGLGLWLVHWIVRRLGGTVELGENYPRGTVVTLRIPTV